MAASPRSKVTFAIDDASGVDENIAAFVLKLNIVDVQLTDILSPVLTSLSNGGALDQHDLLNNFYAATKPLLDTGAGEDVTVKGADS